MNHADPGPGGFYDNLGATEPGLAPHLLPGKLGVCSAILFFPEKSRNNVDTVDSPDGLLEASTCVASSVW